MGDRTDKKYIQCAVMGDGMVGKTSLSDSYINKRFSCAYDATVFDNYVVPMTVAGEDYIVNMFDTGGQIEYERLRSFSYKESEVLLLCFSTCDRDTFASIRDQWALELKRHRKQARHKRPVILVGTQIDLRVGDSDDVNSEEGVQLAKTIGADCYVECSSKNRLGLRTVFQSIIYSGLKYQKRRRNVVRKFLRKIAKLWS